METEAAQKIVRQWLDEYSRDLKVLLFDALVIDDEQGLPRHLAVRVQQIYQLSKHLEKDVIEILRDKDGYTEWQEIRHTALITSDWVDAAEDFLYTKVLYKDSG